MTPIDVERARQNVQRFLTDTAQHLRPGKTPDGAGGYIVVWNVLGTVACRFQKPSLTDLEQLRHAQVSGTARRVLLPWDADVRAGDRLMKDGKEWEVKDVERTDYYVTALVSEVPS